MKQKIFFIVIVVLVLLSIAGVLFSKFSPGTVSTSVPLPDPTRAMASQEQVKEFAIRGLDHSFDISEIRVKKGDTVRIVFTNTEGYHDWVVDEFHARTNAIAPNTSETIEFIADKTGTFEYYCSVTNHRQMGMVGKLIVE